MKYNFWSFTYELQTYGLDDLSEQVTVEVESQSEFYIVNEKKEIIPFESLLSLDQTQIKELIAAHYFMQAASDEQAKALADDHAYESWVDEQAVSYNEDRYDR